MNPFKDKATHLLASRFYRKYYDDKLPRTFIFGINPGRHGAGLTGIPFTDPIKLKSICAIDNPFPEKAELSADFIYMMIKTYGGVTKFYEKFYITSVCPLGFTRKGKNLNYYDDKKLQGKVGLFITSSIKSQLQFGANRKICFCLGEGRNYKYLSGLNSEHQFFETIIPLPHPRFIMQYRRKRLGEYVELYRKKLGLAN